jgi:hypothetical protein
LRRQKGPSFFYAWAFLIFDVFQHKIFFIVSFFIALGPYRYSKLLQWNSVLWNHLFRIRIHQKICSDSDTDPWTNILARNLSKWCPSLFSYVFWNLYVREKHFPIEKLFVLFQVFICDFVQFFLQQCLDLNPYPIPIRFFVRIRIRLKLTDSFGPGSTRLGKSDLLILPVQI